MVLILLAFSFVCFCGGVGGGVYLLSSQEIARRGHVPLAQEGEEQEAHAAPRPWRRQPAHLSCGAAALRIGNEQTLSRGEIARERSVLDPHPG